MLAVTGAPCRRNRPGRVYNGVESQSRFSHRTAVARQHNSIGSRHRQRHRLDKSATANIRRA